MAELITLRLDLENPEVDGRRQLGPLEIVARMDRAAAEKLHRQLSLALGGVDPSKPVVPERPFAGPVREPTRLAFATARPGWESCAHCHAEGRPCWVHGA